MINWQRPETAPKDTSYFAVQTVLGDIQAWTALPRAAYSGRWPDHRDDHRHNCAVGAVARGMRTRSRDADHMTELVTGQFYWVQPAFDPDEDNEILTGVPTRALCRQVRVRR
jgi:hypothetical protein